MRPQAAQAPFWAWKPGAQVEQTSASALHLLHCALVQATHVSALKPKPSWHAVQAVSLQAVHLLPKAVQAANREEHAPYVAGRSGRQAVHGNAT